MPRIILYGGSFDPPGIHHETVVEALIKRDREARIIILPCGSGRIGKRFVASDEDRLEMCRLAFLEYKGIELDPYDLVEHVTSPFVAVNARYAGSHCELWYAVGTDLLAGGAKGASEIQRAWIDGQRVWKEFRFVVLHRPGHAVDSVDLPPHREEIWIPSGASSSGIREHLGKRHPCGSLVSPGVLRYIEQRGLYAPTSLEDCEPACV